MDEETEIQDSQQDVLSLSRYLEESDNQREKIMDEIREMVAGMLCTLGQRRFTAVDSDSRGLKQVGSVQNYFDQFVGIFNEAKFSDEFTVKLFLRGLREEIQSVVGKFKLKTLHEAYCLAKLQEQALIIASKQSSSPAGPNSSCVEEMKLKPEESKHSANDSKSALLSSQQLNTTKLESSISSRDVMVDELHIVGECTDLADYNALACQEDLTDIEPQLFDEMPRRKLIGEQLQVFDEMSKSDYIKKDSQVFEEIPTKKFLGTENDKHSLSGSPCIILNDSPIAGENWKTYDVNGVEFTSLTITLKVLRISKVGDPKIGVVVIEGNLIREADSEFKLISRFERWLEGKHAHDFLWTEWLDMPLPPPEPPPWELAINSLKLPPPQSATFRTLIGSLGSSERKLLRWSNFHILHKFVEPKALPIHMLQVMAHKSSQTFTQRSSKHCFLNAETPKKLGREKDEEKVLHKTLEGSKLHSPNIKYEGWADYKILSPERIRSKCQMNHQLDKHTTVEEFALVVSSRTHLQLKYFGPFYMRKRVGKVAHQLALPSAATPMKYSYSVQEEKELLMSEN